MYNIVESADWLAGGGGIERLPAEISEPLAKRRRLVASHVATGRILLLPNRRRSCPGTERRDCLLRNGALGLALLQKIGVDFLPIGGAGGRLDSSCLKENLLFC